MKICRKSWHYQMVNRYLSDYPPKNLCPYIRQVLIAMLVGVLVAFAASVVALSEVIFVLVLVKVSLHGETAIYSLPDMFVISTFLALTFNILTVGLSIDHFYPKWKAAIRERNRRVNRRTSQYPEFVPLEKTKSRALSTYAVMRGYVKALHDKVCPRIEFVEE